MKLLIASGILLAAVCGAFLSKVMTRSSPPRRTAEIEEAAAPSPAPATAEARRRWAPPAGAGLETATVRMAPQAPENTPENPNAQLQAVAASLKHRVVYEAPDAKWASEMKSRLDTDIYGAKIEHTASVTSRCAATVCEVKVRYDEDVDRNAVAVTLGKLPSFEGGAFYQYDEQAHESTVYVARLGSNALTGPITD
jgi:hypothetical protein